MTSPSNGKDQSRAVAVVKPTAAAELAQSGIDPKLANRAAAIQALNGKNKDGDYLISADLALSAAFHQMTTGHVLGQDFHISDRLGRIEGFRGVAKDAAQRGCGPVDYEFRRMTDEEREDHDIRTGDTAVICVLYQLEVLKARHLLGLPYRPVLGIGIVRDVEKYTNTDNWVEKTRANGTKYSFKDGLKPRDQWKPIELEHGWTWRRKAETRAYKDALRHAVGGLATPEEVLLDAAGRVDNFEFPPEAARLTMEQAEAWAEKQERKAELAARTPEQVARDQAQQRARIAVTEAQGKYKDYRMSMEPCRICGVGPELPIEKHANDCMLRVGFPNAPLLDCEEGEFSPCDEMPGDMPAPAVTPALSPVQARAEAVRQRLVATATGPESWKNGQAADNEAKFAEGALTVLIRDESLRAQVREWLLGERAKGPVTVGWARTLRSWIDATKIPDGEGFLWVPSEQSVNEFRTITEATGFKPAQASLL
jgi:hypothetical protein